MTIRPPTPGDPPPPRSKSVSPDLLDATGSHGGRWGARPKPRMLVIDSAYTHLIMQERDIGVLLTGKNLGGYFGHIWTVHPVASMLDPPESIDRFGLPRTYPVASDHTLIEGKIGRFKALDFLSIANFILSQISLIRHLMRLIRREKIQILRAEDPRYNGLLIYILSRLTGLPYVIGIWGEPDENRLQGGVPMTPRVFKTIWIEERVERFVLGRADRVVVPSDQEWKFAVRKGVEPKNIGKFILGNVLHKVHWADLHQRGDGTVELKKLGTHGAVILCVSRLETVKLVDHVILITQILRERGNDVCALIVGDGQDHRELADLARSMGVADSVIFAGNRDQAWLAQVIPATDIMLAPYTGRALGEAALAGARVIAYDVEWHAELIIPGKTGDLVPHRDIVAMADAAEALLRDPTRAKAYGVALRDHALDYLDPQKADDDQIAFYEELFNSAESS